MVSKADPIDVPIVLNEYVTAGTPLGPADLSDPFGIRLTDGYDFVVGGVLVATVVSHAACPAGKWWVFICSPMEPIRRVATVSSIDEGQVLIETWWTRIQSDCEESKQFERWLSEFQYHEKHMAIGTVVYHEDMDGSLRCCTKIEDEIEQIELQGSWPWCRAA